ncbi:translation initiation factor IF-2-like [Ursus arctos]|uniref:translation initiation factor IF-2-like n=1 Tax=Ursus arctos TaxID=9644 RepID=UPI002546B6F1|nr:translation initiation factor IF-2-like [Ursus arctos]
MLFEQARRRNRSVAIATESTTSPGLLKAKKQSQGMRMNAQGTTLSHKRLLKQATQAARRLGRLPRWGWETLRGPGAFPERRGALDSRPPRAGAQVSSQAGFAAQSPAPPPPRRPRCAPPLSAPGPGGGRWLDPNTRGLWREVGRRRGSPRTARPCPLQPAARRRGAASSPQALGAAAARAAAGLPSPLATAATAPRARELLLELPLAARPGHPGGGRTPLGARQPRLRPSGALPRGCPGSSASPPGRPRVRRSVLPARLASSPRQEPPGCPTAPRRCPDFPLCWMRTRAPRRRGAD